MELNLNSVYNGNCLDVLKIFPNKSIDSIITSPPYYMKRRYPNIPDYIWDNNNGCEHDFIDMEKKPNGGVGTNANVGGNKDPIANLRGGSTYYKMCNKCGSYYGQLGNEPSYKLYLKHLNMIFTEIYRVLKDEGTCFVNIGDTYSTQSGTNLALSKGDDRKYDSTYLNNIGTSGALVKSKEFKDKTLMMIPERFAIQMIDNNWILRNSIIWASKNKIPESVCDRLSTKYEYIYFFVKKEKGYYFDLDSIKDNVIIENTNSNGKNPGNVVKYWDNYKDDCGDFWDIPVKSSNLGHVAPYNVDIIKKLILSGCPKDGIILDPFNGTGTTIIGALDYGRNGIGIDGSTEYNKLAIDRINNKLNEIDNKNKISEFI